MPKRFIHYLLGTAFILAATGIGIIVFNQRIVSDVPRLSPAELEAIEKSSAIGTQARSGDLDEAILLYDATVSAPIESLAEVASSILLGARLLYSKTGSSSDAVQAIRDLERVAADESVRPFLRAYAVLEMELLYVESSGDQAVFEEIFNDSPLSALLVTSEDKIDAPSSLKKLLLHSLQLSPFYRTAIELASVYARELYTKGATPADMEKNIDGAEKYLARAEDLAVEQASEQPAGSARQENYLAARAFVIATLADVKGAPYTDRYRQAYQDLFALLLDEQSTYADAQGRLALGHLMYARALLRVDDDAETAKAELIQAISIAKSDPIPNSAFVRWVRSAKSNPKPNSQAVRTLAELSELSPEFKVFVSGIQ